MTATRPFRAFVSYCHADVEFAAWLQRKLEGYRLPRRLADRVQPLEGQAAGRIGPVFRDRADLSAAEDLSAAVKEAIAASSALIVVASPDAANSHWVAREIALFRELHAQARILVALARGEPAEALPGVLTANGVEPLAADFRPEGDGRRLAFLKIAAGVGGVPLDALIQRDARRQLQRVMVVTVVASSIAIAMATLLILALQAREQAERRRAGAEALIEAMLTNVRTEVKATGNVKLRSALNTLALDYYRAQGALTKLPDDSLQRRARVLLSLGEDDMARSEFAGARHKFEEAAKATAAILQRRPGDPDALFAHAQSEFWVGNAAWRQDKLDRVAQHWGAYLKLAQSLASVEPNSVRSLMELGYAHGNLCELNMRYGRDVTAGLSHCRDALRFDRAALRLRPQDPAIRRALANRLGWFAQSLTSIGEFQEARRNRDAEQSILLELVREDPENVELRDQLIAPDIGIATIEIAEGRISAGVVRLEGCLAKLEQLSTRFPDYEKFLTLRVRVNLLIARALQGANDVRWHRYRDAAAGILSSISRTAKSENFGQYFRMLERIDKGDVT